MNYSLSSKPISAKFWQPSLSVTLGIFLGLGCSLLGIQTAQAANFNFTKIADNNSIFDEIFSPQGAINDQGNVVFNANLKSGVAGIFIGNGKNLSTVIDIDTLRNNDTIFKESTVPSLDLTRSQLDINNQNTVVFSCYLPFIGYTEIFTAQDQKVSVVTLLSRGGSAQGISLGDLDLNDRNSLVVHVVNAGHFIGVNHYISLYSNIGQENQSSLTIAKEHFELGSPDYQSVITPSLNNKDAVAFASINKNSGQIVVSQGNSLIPVAQNASSGSHPSINDHDEIAFISSNNGIFTIKNGNLTNLVNPDNLFNSFESVDINNEGDVAFGATLDTGTKGIFMGADPVADKVIAVGDSLFGSTVTNISFFGKKGLNDQGQIAFYAELADGTSGIFRADPSTTPSQSVPEPSSILSLLALGVWGLSSRRQSR